MFDWTIGDINEDHPRSRGVYVWAFSASPRAVGSSPLARGLPALMMVSIVPFRIIPARAGFTSAPWTVHWPFEDHPRSRGVYCWRATSRRTVLGSSPLARGLPRATRATAWSAPDHPRSRGVYVDEYQEPPRSQGSSPLARGLRAVHRAGHHRLRIIPARAGFTTGRGGTPAGGADHPRSRGVYRTTARS